MHSSIRKKEKKINVKQTGFPNFANKTFANWTFANGESHQYVLAKAQ